VGPFIPQLKDHGLDELILALAETTSAEAPTLTDFGLLRPTDPAVGAPDTIWYREGRLTLIWTSRPGLPDTEAARIGLLLTEFRGSVDREFIGKMVGSGTTLTPVTVSGSTGYWIAGALHDFFYLDANGQVVNDGRRAVGDTLIWTRGTITFRLETSLGREAAIRIAETIRRISDGESVTSLFAEQNSNF